MDKFKLLVVALAVGIVFIPISIYLKGFVKIDAYAKPKVTFDPMLCYACEDCPCSFTLDDGKSYTLNKKDKYLCELDTNDITEGVQKGVNKHSVYMSLSEYSNFSKCTVWHSQHPSNF